MKFGEGIKTPTDRLILKSCFKEKAKNTGKTKHSKEREKRLRRNGCSQQEVVQLRERRKEIILELTTREEQEQFNQIRDAKYNSTYKYNHVTINVDCLVSLNILFW